MNPNDEDPICEWWCHHPVVDGAARLRFVALVYHLACWDVRIDATADYMRKRPTGANDA